MGKKKSNKGKIDNYFGFSGNYESDITGLEQVDAPDKLNNTKNNMEEKSEAQKMREEVVASYPKESKEQFQGKLRRFFHNVIDPLSIKKKTSKSHESLLESKDKTGSSLSSLLIENKTPYQEKEYLYIQMKLDLKIIGPEFEKELDEYRLQGIHVREASMKDLDILVRLYNRAFMKGCDPWSPTTVDQFKEILTFRNTVVLIATKYGEDVGFVITDLEGDNNEIGVIAGLGTDPRWQRRGIARSLGVSAWDYFRKKNVKELRCEVYENNLPSYRLIKSLHFVEYDRKKYLF